MIRGVNAPRPLVDLLWKLVRIGGFELRQRTVVEHDPRQGVGVRQLLQHILRGRGLPGRSLARHRNLQFLEENLLQLFRRLDVELDTGLLVGLCQQHLQLRGDLLALPAQQAAIDEHSAMLHSLQHRDQRLLELRVEPLQGRNRLELRPKLLVHTKGDVRVLGRIGRSLVHGHLVEAQLLGALAGYVLERSGAHAQVTQGDRIHVVPGANTVPDIRFEHCIEAHAEEIHAMVGQHVRVILEMVSDFAALGILENGLERREHPFTIELLRCSSIVMMQGHVGGDTGLDTE